MKASILAASVASLLLACPWAPARAGLPDPGLSRIPNVVMSPTGSLGYTVNIRSTDGPVADAVVVLAFSAEADGLACWAVGQARPQVSAATDAAGDATFNISGGGCLDPAHLATPPVVEVFANGIKMAEVGAVSPDAVDQAGLHPWQGWDPAGTCRVGVGDAVSHTGPFATGTYDFCSDANSDLVVTLADVVIFTQAISSGEFASQQP